MVLTDYNARLLVSYLGVMSLSICVGYILHWLQVYLTVEDDEIEEE